MSKDLKTFIENCMNDKEFWYAGGIPKDEKKYIEELGMSEEQVNTFYESMCNLQLLNKEIEEQLTSAPKKEPETKELIVLIRRNHFKQLLETISCYDCEEQKELSKDFIKRKNISWFQYLDIMKDKLNCNLHGLDNKYYVMQLLGESNETYYEAHVFQRKDIQFKYHLVLKSRKTGETVDTIGITDNEDEAYKCADKWNRDNLNDYEENKNHDDYFNYTAGNYATVCEVMKFEKL